jgi:hypothetical protein
MNLATINPNLAVRVAVTLLVLCFIGLLGNSEALSRKFDLGQDEKVTRSPFARAFLDAVGL